MSKIYYREKIIKLINDLFTQTGDARSRIIRNEKNIQNTYLASKSDEIPEKVRIIWDKYWNELNSKNAIYLKDKTVVVNSMTSTLLSKKNKTMKKYLEFFLEEYYRVL